MAPASPAGSRSSATATASTPEAAASRSATAAGPLPPVHTASAARAGWAVGVSRPASAGSWASTRASSARSSGPGSIPISSISRSRAERYAASASAWRPSQ